MFARRLIIAVLASLALVAAACGDDSGDDAALADEAADDTAADADDADEADDTDEAADDTAADAHEAEEAAPTTPTTAATTTTTTTETAPDWVAHLAPPECMCADGSDYYIHTRTTNPKKVMLYFEGGGACFSEVTCVFDEERATYDFTTGPDDYPGGGENPPRGIFDFDNPANPFADYSMVFVPYCTGDVHLGNITRTYGELTVQHKGAVNAQHGLDYLVENFPDATEVFVTGSSAGGVPAPFYAGLVADELPEASVAVLADASGGYPSNEVFNVGVGSLYDVAAGIPDWPELEGVPPVEIGVPDLFRFTGQHNADIRMARYDSAFDETQEAFNTLIGGGVDLLEVLDRNEELSEAGGAELQVYVAPGELHTILGRPDVYDLEVEGVAFIDWLTDFVDGGAPGDVHCTECNDPDA